MWKMLKWSSSTALKNLGRRKVRSALTILGIAISVLTITAIISIGLGMQAEVESFVGDVLGGSVIVRSKDSLMTPTIPEYVVPLIETVESVEDAIPAIMTMVMINEKMVFIIGIEPSYLNDVFQISYSEGRELLLDEHDKIMLLVSTAESLNANLNDKLHVVSSMSRGGTGYLLEIIGIMDSMGSADMMIETMGGSTAGSDLLGGAGFTTFNTAQKIAQSQGYISLVYVKLTDVDLADEFEIIIEHMLPDAKIMKQDSILDSAGSILDVVNSVLIGLAGISLIVGTLGVMNTIMVSVHERTREIGVLKAIGSERIQVMFLFIMEALYMGLLGGLIGSIIGTYGMQLASNIIFEIYAVEVPILFTWDTYFLGLSVAIGVSILAGLYPSWVAANIKPVEAMRYE